MKSKPLLTCSYSFFPLVLSTPSFHEASPQAKDDLSTLHPLLAHSQPSYRCISQPTTPDLCSSSLSSSPCACLVQFRLPRNPHFISLRYPSLQLSLPYPLVTHRTALLFQPAHPHQPRPPHITPSSSDHAHRRIRHSAYSTTSPQPIAAATVSSIAASLQSPATRHYHHARLFIYLACCPHLHNRYCTTTTTNQHDGKFANRTRCYAGYALQQRTILLRPTKQLMEDV
jgi:hypothetical protein